MYAYLAQNYFPGIFNTKLGSTDATAKSLQVYFMILRLYQPLDNCIVTSLKTFKATINV